MIVVNKKLNWIILLTLLVAATCQAQTWLQEIQSVTIDTQATITWKSAVPSTTRVAWRKVGALGWKQSTADLTLTINHSTVLSPLDPGSTYEYRVKSKDSSGFEVRSSTKTFVAGSTPPPPPPSNQAPTVTASATPNSGVAPLTVQLSSVANDSDGTIASYSWDFGDGSMIVTAQNSTHIYQAAGIYVAKITVTDDKGTTAQASVTITVNEPPPPPPPPSTSKTVDFDSPACSGDILGPFDGLEFPSIREFSCRNSFPTWMAGFGNFARAWGAAPSFKSVTNLYILESIVIGSFDSATASYTVTIENDAGESKSCTVDKTRRNCVTSFIKPANKFTLKNSNGSYVDDIIYKDSGIVIPPPPPSALTVQATSPTKAAIVGWPYCADLNLQISGGTPPYTTTVTGLPQGITFNSMICPSFTLTADKYVVAPGGKVVLTATLPTAVTGSVRFVEGFDSQAPVIGTVQISNGVAVLTTAALTAGNHSFAALYNGNTTYAGTYTVTPFLVEAK